MAIGRINRGARLGITTVWVMRTDGHLIDVPVRHTDILARHTGAIAPRHHHITVRVHHTARRGWGLRISPWDTAQAIVQVDIARGRIEISNVLIEATCSESKGGVCTCTTFVSSELADGSFIVRKQEFKT